MFAPAFARIACSHRYAGFNCAITALMSGLGRHPKSAGRRKDLRCVTMVSYARLFCADLHTHCLNDIIKVIDWYQYNTNLCFRLCHRLPPPRARRMRSGRRHRNLDRRGGHLRSVEACIWEAHKGAGHYAPRGLTKLQAVLHSPSRAQPPC